MATTALSAVFSASASAAGEKLPKLDVAQSCREAQAIAGEDANLTYKGCMHDEKNAEARLQQRWMKFKAVDRQNCLAQGMAPLPSYVEILTCLEMYDDASALYRAGSGPSVPAVEATTPSAPSTDGTPSPTRGIDTTR
jgi:hypothetical protein